MLYRAIADTGNSVRIYIYTHIKYETRLCLENANLCQGVSLLPEQSGIRILISGLIRIRISAGSLPKCFGFIIGVSHFVTVWEMVIKLLKFPIPQRRGKWKSDPESVSRIGSPPKLVSSSNWYIGAIVTSKSFNEFGWLYLCSNPAHRRRQNDWQTNRLNDWSHNLCLGGCNQ